MDTSTDHSRTHPSDFEETLAILREGEARLEGLFSLGSNTTLLCELTHPAGTRRAVYKPVRGEQPLWDFARGSLARRETAAFEIACAIGWHIVPPTVLRSVGPLGPGSFQEFRDLLLECNYFSLRREDPHNLQRTAAFDIIANNADRKAMHLSCDAGGRFWLIDHGLCFHAQPKLRTVIWDFAGEPVPEDILADLEAFAERLHREDAFAGVLELLISGEEIRALSARTEALCAARRYPEPGAGRNVPWPIWA